jgi:hypothetical protein
VKILVLESNIFSKPILKAVLLVEDDIVVWSVAYVNPNTFVSVMSAP